MFGDCNSLWNLDIQSVFLPVYVLCIAKCDTVRKHIPSSFFFYKNKIGKIYYLLLSGKTFHFPDAGSSENVIGLLLKFLEVIPLSCILHSWSSCQRYQCISITTYICPFPWEKRSRMILTLLKFHMRLSFYMSSLRLSKLEALTSFSWTPTLLKYYL